MRTVERQCRCQYTDAWQQEQPPFRPAHASQPDDGERREQPELDDPEPRHPAPPFLANVLADKVLQPEQVERSPDPSRFDLRHLIEVRA